MIEANGKRESRKSVLAAWHDDDMQYMMWFCNVIVNTYLAESNMQDVVSEYSNVKDE